MILTSSTSKLCDTSKAFNLRLHDSIRQARLKISILGILGVFFCSNALAGLIDEVRVLKAKHVCEEKGKLISKGTLKAEGYLFTYEKNGGLLSFDQIAKQLLERRFTFLEIENRDNWSNDLFKRSVGSGKRYYRFHLAPIDSPVCVGYFEEIRKYPAQKLPSLRARGLPVNLCIASERTDESISRYEINVDSNYSANLVKAQGGGFDWLVHRSIRDKSNGEVVAEVSSNGYNSGGHGGNSYFCPNQDQVKLFEDILQPIPDSRLPEPIQWSDLDSQPFPTANDLIAFVSAERRADRRMMQDDYHDHLNPVADNGNLWLHHLSGHEYGLQIVHRNRGIKTNVPMVFGKKWNSFQFLRLAQGEVLFFGQPVLGELHSKEVAVFRYDQNLIPVAAYRIFLPNISFKGDVRYLVDHLFISKDGIDLTLLDVALGPNGNGFDVLAEYDLHAPIEGIESNTSLIKQPKAKYSNFAKKKQEESALVTKNPSPKSGVDEDALAIAMKKIGEKTFRDCPDCPEMVIIPLGEFEMGGRWGTDGYPIHSVTVRRPFSMGKTEVTQKQWRTIMGDNPSYFKACGDNCPVEQVSWNDAKEFILKLNFKTGKQYRLPSEAEWEYACRAGEKLEFCGSNNVVSAAWSYRNSREATHPVAQLKPNAWGIYDMSGNVWEWVEDEYHENYKGAPIDGSPWESDGEMRVRRGGSWYNLLFPRAVGRDYYIDVGRSNDIGFRLAREITSKDHF